MEDLIIFKGRPPLEPRPGLASSGCHDPGQPPPPTRGQLCMTEPSPALTSIRPVPPSLIFVASTSFSYFDSYLLKRLPMVSDCSSGFCNLQPRSSRSCDIWKLLINICNNSLQYLHSTHAAGSLFGLSHNLAMHCTATSRPHPAPAEYRWPSAMTCFLVLVKST